MNYKGLGIRLRNIVNEGVARSFGIKEEWTMVRNVVNPRDGLNYDYQVDGAKRMWAQKDGHQQSYLWKDNYQSARQLAEEITQQLVLKRYKLLQRVSYDDHGCLYLNINDSSLLNLAHLQLANSEQYYDEQSFSCLPRKSAVVLPFAELLGQYDVNHLRGLQIAETQCRLLEVFRRHVVRTLLIRNQDYYHGLILAYVHHCYQQDNKTVQPTMQNVAQFLAQQGLSTDQHIKELSAHTLQQASISGTTQHQVLQTLMQQTHSQTMAVLTSIIPENSQVEIFTQDALQQQFLQWYQQIKEEERKDPLDIQQDSRMGEFIFRGEQIVQIVDQHGLAPLPALLIQMSRALFNRHRASWIALIGHATQQSIEQDLVHLHQFLLQERHQAVSIQSLTHQDVLVQSESNLPQTMAQLHDQVQNQAFLQLTTVDPLYPASKKGLLQDFVMGWLRLDLLKSPLNKSLFLDTQHLVQHLLGEYQSQTDIRSTLRAQLTALPPVQPHLQVQMSLVRPIVLHLLQCQEVLRDCAMHHQMQDLHGYTLATIKTVHDYLEHPVGCPASHRLVLQLSADVLDTLFYVVGLSNHNL